VGTIPAVVRAAWSPGHGWGAVGSSKRSTAWLRPWDQAQAAIAAGAIQLSGAADGPLLFGEQEAASRTLCHVCQPESGCQP
jgi:hypothetical protein